MTRLVRLKVVRARWRKDRVWRRGMRCPKCGGPARVYCTRGRVRLVKCAACQRTDKAVGA